VSLFIVEEKKNCLIILIHEFELLKYDTEFHG